MPITIDALGTVTPLATVTVKTQISGKLMQVGFTEGQLVKEGDFLVQIDARPFEATLRQVILETELLRIRLSSARVGPWQIIVASAEWSLPFFDVSGEADPTAAALLWMSADVQRPTDLLRGPLFAFALFKAGLTLSQVYYNRPGV